MDYSKQIFEHPGQGGPAAGEHKQYNDIQSVQNLETVINEGLRVALLKETPDQSLVIPASWH